MELYSEEDLVKELLRREEAKIHMGDFVPYVTDGIHTPAAHHRIMCKALDRAVRGQCKRLIINMPPAHAKSVYTSHNFPAFWLGNHRKDQIIAAAHTQPFAEGIGRKVRNLVNNPNYTQLFEGLKISADNRAAARWETTEGGSYYTTGVNGPIVGRRANLILIDDPYKTKQVAYSPAERSKISDWFFVDVVPRLLPNGTIIIIQTRWHEDDLAGECIKKGERGDIEPFEVISLTAICEDPENDLMGRKFGEALWPSEYPTKRLLEIKGGMTKDSEDEWNALYMQRPKPAESGEVSSDWFDRFDKPPSEQPYLKFVSWDTAGTENERSDFTVGLAVWYGLKDRRFYIVDMLRKKMEFQTLMREVPAFNARHQAQAVLIENKGTGTSLIQVLRTSGQNIIAIAPQKLGSKEFRFETSIPALEARRVLLPKRGTWVADFLEELLTFPGSQHDDIVDCTSQFINHYAMHKHRRAARPLVGV